MSDETIYKSLFIQARGALKKELLQHLRRTRGMRRSRHHDPEDGGSRTDQGHGCRSVSGPPRSRSAPYPGHWEGDLLIGSKRSQIATLVRTSDSRERDVGQSQQLKTTETA